MPRWFLWCCAAMVSSALSSTAQADEVDIAVSVASNGDWLVVDFRCRELFDDEVREALGSGLPARVTLGIELWQDRSTLWDRHVETLSLSYRVLFDVLQERYEVYDDAGEFVTASDSLEVIETFVGSERGFEVRDLEEFDGDSEYFVSVTAELQPLSVREVRDLEQWIRGSLGRERGGLSGISEHLLGILKNQVGMGERRGQARCATFRRDGLTRREEG